MWTGATLFLVIFAAGALGGLSAQTQPQRPATLPNRVAKPMPDETGFYCNLNALSKAERERLSQLGQKLVAARIETKELPDGYAFRLRGEAVSISDLAEWVSYERKCCPFFDFEIDLQRDSGPLWLKLRGREGVKAFLRNEFGIS